MLFGRRTGEGFDWLSQNGDQATWLLFHFG